MHAHVELGDVQSEQRDAAAQRGEPPVRDALATAGAQRAVDDVEVVEQLGGAGVAGVATAERIGTGEQVETSPDEAELAAVGLADVLIPDLLRVAGQLLLVARDRLEQLGRDVGEAVGDAHGAGEVAHFVAVAGRGERAGVVERGVDRVGTSIGVAVLVAADPGAERERRDLGIDAGDEPAQLGLDAGRVVEQHALEEPETVADLVDHARAALADLVRLPERRDLLEQSTLDAGATGGRQVVLVEAAQQLPHAHLRGERTATGRLGRVGGQHELDADLLGERAQPKIVDAHSSELGDGVGQRLARRVTVVLAGAAATDAVQLLGEVDELEVERERAQHIGASARVEPLDELVQLGAIGDAAPTRGAQLAAQQANALLDGEQVLVALLDDDSAEQVTEHAHVTAQ